MQDCYRLNSSSSLKKKKKKHLGLITYFPFVPQKPKKKKKKKEMNTSVFPECANSCSYDANVLSNWSSSCSFFHQNLSPRIIHWAGLAETAAAHRPPYATAPHHSSQSLSKPGEFRVYQDAPMIYSKNTNVLFPVVCDSLSSMWLISEKKRANWNKFLWSLVVSETIFALEITSLHNVRA